jgi:hypothetical protein
MYYCQPPDHDTLRKYSNTLHLANKGPWQPSPTPKGLQRRSEVLSPDQRLQQIFMFIPACMVDEAMWSDRGLKRGVPPYLCS